jgi:hypothetical protein
VTTLFHQRVAALPGETLKICRMPVMLICLMPQAACDSINAEGGNEQESDCLWRRWINDAACQKSLPQPRCSVSRDVVT